MQEAQLDRPRVIIGISTHCMSQCKRCLHCSLAFWSYTLMEVAPSATSTEESRLQNLHCRWGWCESLFCLACCKLLNELSSGSVTMTQGTHHLSSCLELENAATEGCRCCFMTSTLTEDNPPQVHFARDAATGEIRPDVMAAATSQAIGRRYKYYAVSWRLGDSINDASW